MPRRYRQACRTSRRVSTPSGVRAWNHVVTRFVMQPRSALAAISGVLRTPGSQVGVRRVSVALASYSGRVCSVAGGHRHRVRSAGFAAGDVGCSHAGHQGCSWALERHVGAGSAGMPLGKYRRDPRHRGTGSPGGGSSPVTFSASPCCPSRRRLLPRRCGSREVRPGPQACWVVRHWLCFRPTRLPFHCAHGG
jgi:hypothetical protein